MTQPAFDPHNFRDALSTFATGVTIVTTQDADGDWIGMTASSFNSVSMDPPLVLWSVTKTAFSAPAFKAAENFAVHVLGTDQVEISNRFARSGVDKFGSVDAQLDDNGVPCLQNFACRFDCRTWAVYEGGDHWIIVGQVLGFEKGTAEGLLFAGGSYATYSPIEPRTKPDGTSPAMAGEIEKTLLYHMSRAYHGFSAQFKDSVRKHGLSLPEWRVLASLEGAGVTRQLEELSERTFIAPPALKDLTFRMQKQGLCDFLGDKDTMTFVATDKGNSVVKDLLRIAKELEQQALKGLSKDDLLDQLKAVLKNLHG